MKTALTALIILGVLPGVLIQAEGKTGSTTDELKTRIDQIGRRSPPPAFGEEDAAELKRLSEELSVLRRALLAPGAQPTAEEIRELGKKADKLIPRVRELSQRNTHWKRYNEDPTGDWSAKPGIPQLVPAGAESEGDGSLDMLDFWSLLMRYEIERIQASPTESDPAQGARWIELAKEFGAVAQGRISFGLEVTDENYRLRAALIQGKCLLNASRIQFKHGDKERARKTWEEALDYLHRLDTVFKAVNRLSGDPDDLDFLPRIDPAVMLEVTRRDPQPIGSDYGIQLHRIGTLAGPSHEGSTTEALRATLADYCPWGVPVWTYLKRAGLTEGFDLRILRPYGGDDPQKLWASGVGSAAIPPNVRQHLEDLGTGSFQCRGVPFNLNWEAVQGTGACTVWFLSPIIRDMTAGSLLGNISSLITYLTGGIVAVSLEFGTMVLGAALEEASPDSWPTQVGVGIASEANAWEFDQYLKLKPNALSGVSLAKGALLKILDAFEKAEMKALFEGISPRDDHIQDQIGGQLTYDGTWMPPVVLRASVVGFEQIPDNEYRRMWSFTRYWILDPRGLTGDDTPWDLSTLAVEKMPGASATLAGQLEASEKVWWSVPETSQGWGSQARVAVFEPELQVIDVNITPEVGSQWTKDCPDGYGLVGVMRFPPPYESQTETSPLEKQGQYLRFAFRSKAPVWPNNAEMTANWKPRKLFSGYELHIMRAPRDARGGFMINSADAMDLAEIPIRFTSLPNRPITGKIEHFPGNMDLLTVNYTGEFDRSFDLEPEGGTEPILPTTLLVHERPDAFAKNDTWELRAAMGPTAEGWHTLRVKIEHPALPYPQFFVIHDKVMHRAGAAVFLAKIPLLIGQSKITFSSADIAPKTVLIECAQPYGFEPVDHAKWRQMINEAYQDYQEADPGEWKDSRLLSYLSLKVRYAGACTEGQQYGQTRAILTEELPNEWPDFRRMDPEDVRNFFRYYSETLAEVAFRQGDAVALGNAGPNFLRIKKQEYDRKVQTGIYDKTVYAELTQDWETLINRLILLEGDPDLVAQLHAEWIELRRLSGFAFGQYNHRRFRYLQENY